MMAKSEIVKKNIRMGMDFMGIGRERVSIAMRCCEKTAESKLDDPGKMTIRELVAVCDLLKIKTEEIFRPTKIGGAE